ncbi:preprotein translocase subunit SecG [Candidatus Avelusimicrobium caledoniensis]|uniref:preprotein translocase subunit SecG n=1 Tax=Candidatus Avelusimicrobium caledoniensis TaxID=3416220 RepID=UPI003D0E80D2
MVSLERRLFFMYGLILTLHFIVCVLLILLVLLQSGKGSAAGIFGASGADNLFASPTAFNAVNKFTAILAAVLMATSIVLTIISNKKASSSVMDRVSIPASAPANAGK